MDDLTRRLRSYVYLGIQGFDSHAQVTRHLGLEPTTAWDAGDPWLRPDSIPWKRDAGCWSLGEREFSSIDENEQLDALIDRLVPYRHLLQSTPLAWTKALVMVHETDSCNADMLLTAAQVSFAASIGAAFRLDIYSLPVESPT